MGRPSLLEIRPHWCLSPASRTRLPSTVPWEGTAPSWYSGTRSSHLLALCERYSVCCEIAFPSAPQTLPPAISCLSVLSMTQLELWGRVQPAPLIPTFAGISHLFMVWAICLLLPCDSELFPIRELAAPQSQQLVWVGLICLESSTKALHLHLLHGCLKHQCPTPKHRNPDRSPVLRAGRGRPWEAPILLASNPSLLFSHFAFDISFGSGQTLLLLWGLYRRVNSRK